MYVFNLSWSEGPLRTSFILLRSKEMEKFTFKTEERTNKCFDEVWDNTQNRNSTKTINFPKVRKEEL